MDLAVSPTTEENTSETLEHGQWTPAPWINVVCDPSFGFQASVEGSGYTWSLNSQQNLKLTRGLTIP